MFRSHLALLAVSGLFTLGVISPLAAQVGCDDWNTPAFFKAATAATVQDCLGAGADPNARDAFGFTPLHWAAAESQTPEVVTALVNAGADPNARDQVRQHPAAPRRRQSARHRRSSRPSSTPARTPTRATGTASHRCTRRRHSARHRRSSRLSSTPARTPTRATPIVTSSRGARPLPSHRCTGRRQFSQTPEVVTALVNAGADPNARDGDGGTPLGGTPLHAAAAISQTPEVVTALVNAGGPQRAH